MLNRSWLLLTLLCLLLPAATAQQAASAAHSATLAPTAPAQATTPKPAATPLPKPQTPEEFFNRAREFSDLEAAGIPFHLKATFVASGNAEFTGNGTYEEWWLSSDKWRKEATLGNFKYVSIKNADQQVTYTSSSYVPLRVRQAMQYALIRILPSAGQTGKVKLKRAKAGPHVLEEVEEKSSCNPAAMSQLTCDMRYEFAEDGLLRLQHDNSVTMLYNNLQPLQGRLIPRKILVATMDHLSLTIDITMLETPKAIDGSLFDTKIVPAHLKPAIPILEVDIENPDQHITKLLKDHMVDPQCTLEPNQQRVDAALGIVGTIDATGKLREPYVYISGGKLLDDASMQAFRQCRFQPPLKDGKSVNVETLLGVTSGVPFYIR
ncbi:MAG TPA: energy transducer TonB [Acidobacteriaceae bacterium]|jgi:hypothetical protein|nr:energy transducer TonB [Acidobacteriaceae bacterium]